MIQVLIKRFIPNYENTKDKKVREAYGVLSGFLGIFCNFFLFGIKLIIGLLMNSIAVTSDAFNNLSDIGSSLVAIFGAKMSNRRADREHPLGHGRIEYIASLIVSFIILLVGFELLKNSFNKVLHPEAVVFNPILILILALSVLVKIWMFSYNRFISKAIQSDTNKAIAYDSLNDVIATSAVILTTIAGQFIRFPLDGIVGIVVSLLIMYTGFGIAKDTVNVLLGTSPSPELVDKINAMVVDDQYIVGVHDLIVHDYGPGRVVASLHAEVPNTVGIVKIHSIIDALERRIYDELGIDIVIHMDPLTSDPVKIESISQAVTALAKELDARCSVRNIRITDGELRENVIFDWVIPAEVSVADQDRMMETISKRVAKMDAKLNAIIHVVHIDDEDLDTPSVE